MLGVDIMGGRCIIYPTSAFTCGNVYLQASCYYLHCISPMYLLVDSRELLSCKCRGISRELVAFSRYCGFMISRAIIRYLVRTREIALTFSLGNHLNSTSYIRVSVA